MESILKFLFGLSLIVFAILWFAYEQIKFLKERENEEYIMMSFTLEFLLGAFTLCAIGIKLICDSI